MDTDKKYIIKSRLISALFLLERRIDESRIWYTRTTERLAEIQNLKISNINFKENKFTIIGKGNKERMCYLTNTSKDALLEYLAIRNEKNVINKSDKDIYF